MGAGSLRPWHIMTNYPANEHQPPLVLPRWITHPNLPQGKEQVTLPMNFSPLSFSPEGEMQVSPNCQRLVDTGYSELSKTDWFRLKTCWCWLLLLMCQTFHFIGIFVQFWASSVPTWGKHVAPLGHVCCTEVAHLSPIWQTPSVLKPKSALGLAWILFF